MDVRIKVIHEVKEDSYAFFLMNAFIGAINRHADAVRAVAVAIAASDNPANAEAIKQATLSLKASTDSLQEAVDSAPK